MAFNRKVEALQEELRTDSTLNTAAKYARTAPRKFLPAAGQYLLQKVPIVEWLPRYSPTWLLPDAIAGLTIGVMLIPQGLAYAQIATIPIENGLYSSWVPAAVAVFMGTSKGAVSLMVGIYCLILGLAGLGFLLDYVSVPVLTGFISATALIIGFGQADSLVGLNDAPDGLFNIIGYLLKHLPEWDGPTCGIGFSTILVLLALEKVGKKWGKKHFAIKYLASSRAVIVLVIYTLISYLVNRDREEYAWEVSKVDTNGIITPQAPDGVLIGKVASRAIAPLVACSLEHLAVGKAFGRKNGYSIDQSQELNYLGVTNIINSFFLSMPVGGAMSRTAVNSECRVRSPLNGAITAGFIILTLYVFSPALYWLPKATLAAIIIMAVIHLFGPLSLFWRYWRISLADFIASQVAFWVTIFVSAEVGIGAAAGWSVAWSMIRSAFVKPDVSTNENTLTLRRTMALGGKGMENVGASIPDDVAVVHFTDSVFFPNANRAKVTALENVSLVYPTVQKTDDNERSWSVASQRRLERLRAQHSAVLKETALSAVVWDFISVPWIDVTGILALAELKDDIRRQLGGSVSIRMVGMTPKVYAKFRRADWPLSHVDEARLDGSDLMFDSMEQALWHKDGSSLEGVTSEKAG
ncbi:hypothetical protein DL771_000052 [Monosporascus sp. 5C6A]|nr:hypothetical protein DL771_000052 [Monosporascus sp. 5C6A]